MNLDCLVLEIVYDTRKNEFIASRHINDELKYDLVETFLRGQIGKGEDYSRPNHKDRYNITLRWYPNIDMIEVWSDTGNKGLRDGILLSFLEYLSAKQYNAKRV